MTVSRRSSRLVACACALAGGGALALPGLAGAAPAVSGADGDAWSTVPSYLVTPDPGAVVVTWAATNGEYDTVTRPTVSAPFTVTLGGREFREGEHVLTVIQRQEGSEDRLQTVARRFTIDRTPPGPVQVQGPPAVSSETAFGVSWAGHEAGARFAWSVVAGTDPAAVVRPPVETAEARADIAGLPAGSYAVAVVQIDRARNAGPAALFPVSVVPPPTLTPTAAPPPAARPAGTPASPPVAPSPSASPAPTVRLPSLRTARLRPRKGIVLRNRRPMLSWARGPKGTTVYNVQIFRVGKVRPRAASNAVPLRKVRSAFPRARRMRTPVLARGGCYVWRVWPFRGRTFTKAPLGISNFCVAKNARIRR